MNILHALGRVLVVAIVGIFAVTSAIPAMAAWGQISGYKSPVNTGGGSLNAYISCSLGDLVQFSSGQNAFRIVNLNIVTDPGIVWYLTSPRGYTITGIGSSIGQWDIFWAALLDSDGMPMGYGSALMYTLTVPPQAGKAGTMSTCAVWL